MKKQLLFVELVSQKIQAMSNRLKTLTMTVLKHDKEQNYRVVIVDQLKERKH